MPAAPLPDKTSLTIGFGHAAYRMAERFAARGTGISHFEVKSAAELRRRVGEADVLVVSGFWQNDLLEDAPRLRFVQSISAGVNQYALDAFRAHGVRLASARGVNERAVAEHAMALMLALSRQLHVARDNQARRHWRGMATDPAEREDELAGKTLLVVGLGLIGTRLAHFGKALGMRVLGVRRSASAPGGPADAVHGQDRLLEVLPEADVIALTCPLTPETTGLIGREALARMKPSAMLINVARGAVVDEPALIEALRDGKIAGAGLDVTIEEPLPADSPLWGLRNVLITPHTAGETLAYEERVIDLLLENLDRLWRGDSELRNQVV
ncbi:MAG TPA: D-2-hydroxyacid dehydrogenase [Hyphomicrobiaceae bacterium]|nr:D-2-hydroxyacid dehydrogenase [Hyphomicrobiaceae bacterium]